MADRQRGDQMDMAAQQAPALEAGEAVTLTRQAAEAARALVDEARRTLAERLGIEGGRVPNAALEGAQDAAHALSWFATYAEALAQLGGWADRLAAEGRLGELERLILQIGAGEYLAQMIGGIPMSQGEIARPAAIGIGPERLAAFAGDAAVARLVAEGNTQAARVALARLMAEREGVASFGATGLDDELEMVREQFRRFAEEKVVPHAHRWHLADELIPLELIAEMAELGVFGLTIPEEYGGLGMSKAAMCVVSEELSRGWIGVGSLGTRAEIAAELILGGGTEAQKRHWLPRIASGEVLPTAVFTEPNTGSDLGSLRTRAVRDG
ncbi:MAG: acyl-CoA dehydrogenase family protein, partial [Alphaproteobacteria bacterium]